MLAFQPVADRPRLALAPEAAGARVAEDGDAWIAVNVTELALRDGDASEALALELVVRQARSLAAIVAVYANGTAANATVAPDGSVKYAVPIVALWSSPVNDAFSHSYDAVSGSFSHSYDAMSERRRSVRRLDGPAAARAARGGRTSKLEQAWSALERQLEEDPLVDDLLLVEDPLVQDLEYLAQREEGFDTHLRQARGHLFAASTRRRASFSHSYETVFPTQDPTSFLTQDPTSSPTQDPTFFPTYFPTSSPTQDPTFFPT